MSYRPGYNSAKIRYMPKRIRLEHEKKLNTQNTT